MPSRHPEGEVGSRHFRSPSCWTSVPQQRQKKPRCVTGASSLIFQTLLGSVLTFGSAAVATSVASVTSDSVRPHRRQPTRLARPWDSPGKNTRVGCHFLLQCMKVKSESEVAQSCPTPSDPMDCSLPGSPVHWDFPGKSTGVGCHCLLRTFGSSSICLGPKDTIWSPAMGLLS